MSLRKKTSASSASASSASASIASQILEDPDVQVLLTSLTKETFHRIWVDNLVFCNNMPSTDIRCKWMLIYLLFYEFGNMGQFSKKSNNIWFNEIREIALFNLFSIDSIDTFKSSMELMFTDEFAIIKDTLLHLYTQWTEVILHCAYQTNESSNDYEVISLEKKGGQKFPYDFELIIKNNSTHQTHTVKLEFKFSNSGNERVTQLAEFAALNTESENGLNIFEDISYLDFFWDMRYLQRMVDSINTKWPDSLSIEELTKDKWKKTAKSVSKPKESNNFHNVLREKGITDYPDKKTIVNESFGAFITNWINSIKEKTPQQQENYFDKISEIFNLKQRNKFFCIFSNGSFKVDTIPELKIVDVMQSKPHVFNLICNGALNIHCGMSWGNGGAGNQNPRVLFKLLEGVEPDNTFDEVEDDAFSGGGGESDEDEYDWFIIHEELALGDTEGKKELDELTEITSNNIQDKKNINKSSVALRRSIRIQDRIDRGSSGGKKSTKKNRKRTKKGLKKNKTRKVKRGRRK